MEKLASLKPLHPEIEGFSITAGNSSGLNDGAAAMVIVDSEFAQAHGLKPMAVVKSWASAGLPPQDTGLGPTSRSRRRSTAPGMTSATSTCSRSTRRSRRCASRAPASSASTHEITNVNGSGCSLGHPVAATGARMIVTLVHELRRRGGGIGVSSMCAGGGMGSATVVEVMAP